MERIIEITGLDMPEIKIYTALTEAQLRNRLEPEKGIFIAESPKVIISALEAGCVPKSFLMERRHIAGQGAELIRRCPHIPVYTGERDCLKSLTGYTLTRGILCAMERPAMPTVEMLCKQSKRIAVLENIVDTTNLGAIFRSAAALGMDGILLSPSCADPLNRRAVRVSMGTVLQIPWTYLDGNWPAEGTAQLKEMGFKLAAMALCDDSCNIDNPKLLSEEKLAVILGTEGTGLCKQTISACDYRVMIPMARGVDSLKVAAAAAIAFWQVGKEK